MNEDFRYDSGACGPKNRILTSIDANSAEDLRCLAAKCVYGSETQAVKAYFKLDGLIGAYGFDGKVLFERLGKLGIAASERAEKRKKSALDRAINNMCRQSGRNPDSERGKPAGD